MAKRLASPDELLSVEQAAKVLGLSARQVRTHAQKGRLPAKRLGARAWVFRRGDVEAFEPKPAGRPPA